MLIQPYVENAVKHGLLHKSGNRILRIEFQMQDYDLFVRIEDNGIGRKRAMEILQAQSFRHTSFSTQANARRLDILNRLRNRKVNITFEDKYDNESQASGTVVTLYIPIDFHGK
jgi:LytS/YehU family sensor histidine kinase